MTIQFEQFKANHTPHGSTVGTNANDVVRFSVVIVGLAADDALMTGSESSTMLQLEACFDDLAAFEPLLRIAGVRHRMVVILDWDMLTQTSDRLDRILTLRKERPDLCIMLRRTHGETDIGLERLPLCDATVPANLPNGVIEALALVALRNNSVWQERCRDMLGQRVGVAVHGSEDQALEAFSEPVQ